MTKDKEQKQEQPDQPLQLGYWNTRGVAQPIRYLLEYMGLPYEERRYQQGDNLNRNEWLNVKDSFEFALPSLPYLIDGKIKLTYSNVIMEYLTSKYQPKLGGLTIESKADIQMHVCYLTDCSQNTARLAYDPKFSLLLPDYKTKTLKSILSTLSGRLGKSDWLVGGQVSTADFLAYEVIKQNCIMCEYENDLTQNFPNLSNYLTRFEALPRIQAYFRSNKFISRPINNKSAAFQ